MDQDWLVALRNGDDRAFRRLFDATERRVFALASRLVNDEVMAREVTQEVFVQAWRGMRHFRGDSTIDTWLHTICVRVARRYWRVELRRRARETFHSLMSGGTTSPPITGIAIDLEAAIRQLPPRMRAAIVLTCVEGHSHAEAARILGSAEGTIKAQVHRGRQLLRERLER